MIRPTVALLLVASLCPAADPNPKSLEVPPTVAAEVTELIKHLSFREYAERDEATRELRKLGRLALPALSETLATSTNPEVRLRVEMLLPAAVSDDLRAKVDCYLADTDNKYQHDLPGAKAFFKATGRSDKARHLYADLMKSANRDLITAVDGPAEQLNLKYTARRGELNLTNGVVGRPGSVPSVAALDIAAVLFAESMMPDNGPVVGAGVGGVGVIRNVNLLSNYYFQTSLKAALDSDVHKEPIHAIFKHWMDSRSNPQTVYSIIIYMNRYNSADGLVAARKLAFGKVEGGPGMYRANAISYVGRFGNPATDQPEFEKLFSDKTLATSVFIGGVNRQQQIQVRDIALTMAILQSKQNPTDYGFVNRYGNAGNSDSLKYNYAANYIDADTPEKADEKREAALKKYNAWKAKQKDKPMPKEDEKEKPKENDKK